MKGRKTAAQHTKTEHKMKKLLAAFAFLAAVAAGCSSAQGEHKISIASWNVQCFFDAITHGTEYKEFKSSKWNRSAYETRLERLCSSIKTINADIFVLQEIENDSVIVDISNRLQDFSWNQNRNWNYATFSKNSGDSIGCAVISRFPIIECTAHNIDIRTEKKAQPNTRPITAVKIDARGEKITLLVNHWKSKSGGGAETEVWRNWQESLLYRLFEKSVNSGEKVVACGDFNRDINEFLVLEKSLGKIAFRKAAFKKDSEKYSSATPKIHFEEGSIHVFSPWFSVGGAMENSGSYHYRDCFERIDHFFLSENIGPVSFSAVKGPWCDEHGIPMRYQIFTGRGYSDHLPIHCVVDLLHGTRR